uniref:ABC transporter domain-containing protein n=1 Tax=Plectus sambesii TaxID=2011161 RepID=A0A914WMC3_9BILA
MGQLWTLVWKNFCWCLRHPIITVIFFVIPSLAAYGTWYVMPEEIAHNEQCSYPALALFPSPANSLFGALCCFTSLYDNKVSCMTEMWQPGIFVQPHEFVNNWTDSAGNFHCPGSNTDQHEFQTSQSDADYLIGAIRQSCSKRSIYIWDISRVYQFSVLDFLFHGMILYYPTNEQTRNFTNKMVDALNHLGHQAQKLAAKVTTGNQKSGNFCITDAGERTVGFSSKSEALDYALARNLTDQIVWGIIEFKSMSHDFRYKLITHTGMRYETSTLYLQSLIESTAVEYLSGQKWVDNIDSKLLPERCRKRPQQYEMAFFVSGALMTFCLFAVAYVITSEISAEKAAGLTELLFIAGVPRWKVKLSWTIFGAAFMLTICLGIGIFLKFGLAHLVENTDFSLLMVLMALHATSLISVCLFFASFMPSGEKAGALMIVSILIAYYVPNWTNLLPDVGYDKNIALARVLSLIHPTISIQIGIGYVFAFEKEGIGLSWMALADSPSAFDKFYGMLEIFIDLLAQIIVYSILSWYFDQTAPSRYGLKQPWLFPFYPSYWRPKPTENSPPKIDAPDAEKVEDFAKQRRSSMMRITHDGTVVGDTEESDGVLKAGIKICGLTKSYGKNKVAVNDLTVAFYENEITAFLGHNGAGKSTTINMLTGMTTPTTGTALLGGKDIWTHMNKIRRSLGFCPQYDMIYPNLTVREHMRFYGALKGFSKANVDAYSDKILAQLQMNSSQTLKTIAKKLSGGMKRKLCIALAFLGDPDIVVLDEPTSAIDPFSRRAIWDVILRHRSKSTILLSTHNMEEADILGDRIAIIDHGKLKCYGTTMYLKSKYGKGFRLIIAHNGHVNSASLTDDLEQFIPVTFIGITATEVVYSIDMQYTKSPRIVDLFHYLETSVQDSNILSFGISEATMEQVFLNVAVGDAPESGDQVEQEEEQLKMGGFNGNSLDIRSGPGLLAMQWWATWVKRANISVRQPIGFFFQVFSPILMGALLIVLLRLIKTQADSSVSLKNSTNTNEQLMDMNIIGYSKKLLIFTGTRYSWIQKSLLADGLGAKCASRDRCSATSASFPSNDLDYDTSKLYCTCEGCPYTSPNPAATVILPSGESLLSLSPAWASQDRIDAYLLGVNHPGLTGLIQEIGGDVTIWTGVQVNPWLRATDVAQLPMRALLYNALSNARLRNFTGSNEFSITFYAEDQYIVRDDGLVTSQRRQYGIDGILKELVVVLISAVSLAVPFFNVLIVLLPEQNNGSKQLQHLMGMSRRVQLKI